MDHTVAGRIDAYIFYEELRIGDHQSGGQEKSSRGNITRNGNLLCKQFFGRSDNGSGFLCADISTEFF